MWVGPEEIVDRMSLVAVAVSVVSAPFAVALLRALLGLLSRSREVEPADVEVEGGPVIETWVDDSGPFTVTVLGWHDFRDMATGGGRVSFSGMGRSSTRDKAARLGLSTWYEHGSFWLDDEGRIYRSEPDLA